MAFIPDDAEWYVADLVLEIRVEGDPRSVVHVNTTLIRAASPDEAFELAHALGRDAETEYQNPAGARVVTRFRGLAHLDVIHEKLEHGAELFYSERVGLSGDEISRLTKDKVDLEAFAPIRPKTGPDYTAGDILAEARARLRAR